MNDGKKSICYTSLELLSYFLFLLKIHSLYCDKFPLPHLLKDPPHLTPVHLFNTMPSFSFSVENKPKKAKQTMNNRKHKQEKTQETCMCVCVCVQNTGNHNVQAKRVRILQMLNHRNKRQKHLLKHY